MKHEPVLAPETLAALGVNHTSNTVFGTLGNKGRHQLVLLHSTVEYYQVWAVLVVCTKVMAASLASLPWANRPPRRRFLLFKITHCVSSFLAASCYLMRSMIGVN